MAIIDDRTTTLGLALPHQDNQLIDDVARLREALTDIDSEFAKKGQADGYAGLGSDGKVPSGQLPSYVDDVIEVANFASLPGTGEASKIYITLDNNKVFRWSGSAYIEIVASPGSTDSVPEGSTNKYFTDARARAAQQPATASTLGVVKVGVGLNVEVDGTLSVSGTQNTFDEQVLPITSNGQTVFTVTGGYVPGRIELILNGSTLNGVGNDDYTATNGTTITLASGVSNALDTLVLRRWSTFNVANAIQKAGDNMAGPLGLYGDAVNPLEAVPKQQFDLALLKSGGVATGDITVPSLNGWQLAGTRNRIINGKMEIAQRGITSATLGNYVLDNWFTQVSGTSAAGTLSKQADGPTSEFSNSLRVTVTTADTVADAADIVGVQQRVEGYNVSDFVGKTFTLSFWVKSPKTGVHPVAFRNQGSDRAYVAQYTVNAANTWEYKTVTVTGGFPNTGTWDFTTGRGVTVSWPLLAGSNHQTTVNSWTNGNYQSFAGAPNLLDTVGNVFAITAVQLEPGPVATPFEHRSYAHELYLCQRYYYRATVEPSAVDPRVLGTGFCRTTTVASILVPIPQHMRSVVAIDQTGTAANYSVGIAASAVACSAVPTLRYSGPGICELNFTVASGLTAGSGCTGNAVTNVAAYLGFRADM